MFIEKLLDNLDVPTIVILAIFTVTLIVYIVVKISGMVLSKKLKPLAEMLNAEVKSSFTAGTYIGILNYGPEIRFKITLGGGNSPSFLIMELHYPVGFKFKIIQKQALNQVFFRWGEEVKLNDASLDEEYLIRSDKPDEVISYLSGTKRIEAIKYFFENKFSSIETNDKGVFVIKTIYTDEDLVIDKVKTYLDNLNSFSRM